MSDNLNGRGLPLIQFWGIDEAPANIRRQMRKSASCEWAAVLPSELSRSDIADFLAGSPGAIAEIPQEDGSVLILGGAATCSTLSPARAAGETRLSKRKS
jgi:hypothetical protein